MDGLLASSPSSTTYMTLVAVSLHLTPSSLSSTTGMKPLPSGVPVMRLTTTWTASPSTSVPPVAVSTHLALGALDDDVVDLVDVAHGALGQRAALDALHDDVVDLVDLVDLAHGALGQHVALDT